MPFDAAPNGKNGDERLAGLVGLWVGSTDRHGARADDAVAYTVMVSIIMAHSVDP